MSGRAQSDNGLCNMDFRRLLVVAIGGGLFVEGRWRWRPGLEVRWQFLGFTRPLQEIARHGRLHGPSLPFTCTYEPGVCH
jgi:hypothetical protein